MVLREEPPHPGGDWIPKFDREMKFRREFEERFVR